MASQCSLYSTNWTFILSPVKIYGFPIVFTPPPLMFSRIEQTISKVGEHNHHLIQVPEQFRAAQAKACSQGHCPNGP